MYVYLTNTYTAYNIILAQPWAHERDHSCFLFLLRKMTKSGLQSRNSCVALESVPGVRRPSGVTTCHFLQAIMEIK